MKGTPAQEKALMSDLWSHEIKNSPLKFVKYVFEWGKPDTPLADFEAPRAWQEKILLDMERHIARNGVADAPEMFRLAVASGRGIGKSALVAWLILWMLSTRLGATIIVTANTEQQLRSRTWAELGKWMTLAVNNHWFTKTATAVKPSAWFEEALVRDLKIDTGYYYAQAQLWSEENPDAFAGIHSNYGVMLIMDEASGIPGSVYSVSEGFFTEPTKDRYWLTFSNPRRNSGAFYDSFHSAKEFWQTEQINSLDVEGTDKVLFQKMLEQYGEDSQVARVEVRGLFPKSDEDTAIPLEIVKAAVERDVELQASQPIIWGVDVSRLGADKSALVVRQGNHVLEIQTFNNMDLMQFCGAIKNKYDETQTMNKPKVICIDSIGLGAGVVDRLREQDLPVKGVNVAESPSSKKTYLNLRAELWFKVKEWLESREVRIPNDDGLVYELASPSYSFTSAGKLKLESKQEMKKRGYKSPDKGDALAITFSAGIAGLGGAVDNFISYNSSKPLRSRIKRVG